MKRSNELRAQLVKKIKEASLSYPDKKDELYDILSLFDMEMEDDCSSPDGEYYSAIQAIEDLLNESAEG